MKNTLNTQIVIGAVTGVLLGAILNILGKSHALFGPSLYTLELIGGIFVSLLKMILIPLVLTSITVGIANLRAHAQIGLVWKTTLAYFIFTTMVSVALGLLVVNIFRPGHGLEISFFQDAVSTFHADQMTLGQFTKRFASELFVNPFSAMANGNVLAVVIFSIFLGVALVKSGDKRAQTIIGFFNEFFEIMMMIVGWIMVIAPFGIMALLAKLVATQNVSLFAALGKFMAVVIGATLFHGFVILPGVLYFITKISPVKFFKETKDALITALSTSSSSATMPITLRCTEENLKVNKGIAVFVVPLGTTVNMDGTALYEAVAAIFIANLVGAELNFIQQLIVFFTSMIAAIGAPGIPSAGMVTMIMVLQSVGLPEEAIAILLPIDRLLDTIRTMVNVEGDMIASLVIQKLTGATPSRA